MAALDPSTLTYISLLLIQDLHRLWVSFERLSYGVSSGPEIGRRRGGRKSREEEEEEEEDIWRKGSVDKVLHPTSIRTRVQVPQTDRGRADGSYP